MDFRLELRIAIMENQFLRIGMLFFYTLGSFFLYKTVPLRFIFSRFVTLQNWPENTHNKYKRLLVQFSLAHFAR